jgi:ABC-type phosphate/phosphonate transport system ATPase subunit
MPAQVIKISGARQHNLKNLHVEIPREKLVVFTGLSGSGKSSLCRRPTPLRQSFLVGPENDMCFHKSCAVPATAHQSLQQVVNP